MDEIYLVEFSQGQNKLAISTLEEAASDNLAALLAGYRADYVVVGFAGRYEDAQVLSEQLRNLLDERHIVQ